MCRHRKVDCRLCSTAIRPAANSEAFVNRTRVDYVRQIEIIELEFGDFPIKALAARETRGLFMEWRDRLALKSIRQATTLDRTRARPVVGKESGQDHRQSMRERRPTLQRHPCRLYLGARRRRGIPEECSRASSSAIAAGSLDWAAPGRPLASHVVGLRRDAHSSAAIKERTPGGASYRSRKGTGWRATQSGTRRGRQAQAEPDHPANVGGAPMDAGWIPRLVAQGFHEGWDQRSDLQ